MLIGLKWSTPHRLARPLKPFSSATAAAAAAAAANFNAHSPVRFLDQHTGTPVAAQGCLVKIYDFPYGSPSAWNKILHYYCNCGLLREARNLFDEIPSRDAASYNTLICALARHGRDSSETLRLYQQMLRENTPPNHITLPALLSVSSDLVEQVHPISIKLGLNTNAFVGGAMVKGYEVCRGLEEAIRTSEEIKEMDSVSWNIVIDACARRGSKRHAVEMFSRMQKEGTGDADSFTLTSVLKTCLVRADLSLGMQLHGCSWKAGLVHDTPVTNALVTMYLKCGGEEDAAVDVFRGILYPNIISWSAMIAGLVQNGLARKAASFYQEMVHAGMMENEFCFASVAPAFGMLANLDHGRMVHSRIIKSDLCGDVMVGNALIDMYFKCGSVADAQLAFKTMRNRDVVSWTIMILGYGQHGKGEEAIQIFKELERSGVRLDPVTFLAILSACSYGGLLEEGIKIFHSMVNDHDIKPKREHYACMIGMLGRAGRLIEAERFIQDMGIQMDPLAWQALLGACGMHGAIELGEKSAEKVMELEPDKDGPYVLLSNIYAEQNMWEEKEKLRERLDASMLVKEVGRSWSSAVKE